MEHKHCGGRGVKKTYLFGVYPPGHLVKVCGVEVGRELVDLEHCLANSCACFVDLGHKLGIVENAAVYLSRVAFVRSFSSLKCEV